MKYIKFILWNIYYLFVPKSDNIVLWLRRDLRCRFPRKFKPCLWHNEEGKQWEIVFTQESPVSQQMRLQVTADIGQDSGNIVGLTIWDETLRDVDMEK